jgi:hypothetical protein
MMPLASYALATVQDLYDYLKEPAPASGSDAERRAEFLINGASAYLRQQCKTPLRNETFTEKYDGHGFDSLRMNNRPIQSVDSVLIDGVDRTADIEFDRDRIFLVNDRFPYGRRNVVVTYTAGHGADIDDLPADLRFACVLLAHYRMKQDQMNLPMESMEGPFVLPAQNRGIPREVNDVIREYRRRGF